LVLAVWVTAGSADSCELFAGKPSWCVPYLNNLDGGQRPIIFLPGNITQDVLAAVADDSNNVALVALSSACRRSMHQIICLSVFRKCEHDSVTGEAKGVRPCLWTCLVAHDKCESFGEDIAPACNTTDPLDPTQPLFVDATASARSANASVQCVGDGNIPYPVPVDCPKYFAYSAHEDMCVAECPIPLDGWDSRQAAYLYKNIIISLSMVMVTLCLIPNLMYKRMRKFPHHMSTCFGISFWIFGLSLLLTDSAHVDDYICLSKVEFRDHNDPLCLAQSILYLWSLFASYMWWMWSAVNLLVASVNPFKWHEFFGRMDVFLCTHILSWGIGIPLIIILFSFDSIANPFPNAGICVASNVDMPYLVLGVFDVPIFCLHTLGSLVGLFCVIFLIKHNSKLFGPRGGLAITIREYWRMIIFLVMIWLLFGNFVGFLIHAFVVTLVLPGNAEDFYRCRLEGKTDCPLEGLNFPFYCVVLTTAALFGITYAVVYGTTPQALAFWRTLLTTGRLPSDATSSTPAGSAGSSGSNRGRNASS